MNNENKREIVFESAIGFHVGVEDVQEHPFHLICFIPKEEDLEKEPEWFIEYSDDTKPIKWSFDIRTWFQSLKNGELHAIESLFSNVLFQKSEFYQRLRERREEIVRMFGANVFHNYVYRYFENLYFQFSYYVSKYEQTPNRFLLEVINLRFVKIYRMLDCMERYLLNEFESFEKALHYHEDVLPDIISLQVMQDVISNRFSDTIFSPNKLQSILLDKRNQLLEHSSYFSQLKPIPSFIQKLNHEFHEFLHHGKGVTI